MSKMKAILAMAALSAGFACDRSDGAGDQGADPLSRAQTGRLDQADPGAL